MVNPNGDAIASASTTEALVDITALFGADGPATTDNTQYALAFTNTTSGLTLTDGSAINLVDINGDGSVIVGQVSGGTFDGQAAFALSVDPDTGFVTVEQYLSLDHPTQHDGSNTGQSYDEALDLSGSDLAVTVTVTDGDGDTAISDAVPVGAQITFDDDGPSVTATADTDVTAALDEGDQDAGSPSTGVTSVINTGAITKGDDPHVVNTNGDAIAAASTTEALVDITALFGADGPATTDNTQYALAFTNTTSGLTLTDGSAINLVDINGDGSVIVGQVSGGTFDGQAAFALSVDPDTGFVTVEQYLSLDHPTQHDGSNTGQSYDEALDLSGSDLAVTVTVTDGDGDTAISDAVPVGAQITFDDDGPSVTATADTDVTAALDEGDQDAGSPSTGVTSVINTGAITKGDDPHVVNTNGDAIAAASTTEALVDITALFGADGPATTDNTQYALAFTNTTSGLTLTDGSAINLVDINGDGSVIVGQVSGGTFDGQAAFALSVDPDTGFVTVEQYLSLDHPTQHDGSNTGQSYDEALDLSGSDLAVTVTVTDGDGDTAISDAVPVGAQITFDDDGPSVTATADTDVTAALDEGDQDAGSPSTGVTSVINTGAITKGDDPHVVNTNGDAIAAASTTEALVDITALFGADGPATTDNTQYALAFTNTTSGLTLTDGSAINLVDINGDGSVIVGQVSGGTFDGQAAFALSVDPDTGFVTAEQYPVSYT
ncbi:DUF5801 repeats-in-toxin domain-containing protein, partial [Anderseniella sp. Alg231-50]|uniref:DUF5801 repeats-in-toxin domain-containing protein n=1 Tax=Anderseniella sp. Alg231-50 TaxID=1922226 RepID=UPI00307CC7C6